MPLEITDKQTIPISAALCLGAFKRDPDVGPYLDKSNRIRNETLEEHLFESYPDDMCKFYINCPDTKYLDGMYALGHYWRREYVDDFGKDIIHFENAGKDSWVAPLQAVSEPYGHWIFRFDVDNLPGIDMACRAAVEQGAVTMCDHTSFQGMLKKASTRGQARFWINDDSADAHKKLILFLLQNGLLPKSNFRPGEYMDIQFMSACRSKNRKRRTDTLRLSHFIDLKTGKWRKGMKP